MGIEEFIALESNEELMAEYNCKFPTKAQHLIDRVGEKKVLLVFKTKYNFKEMVDEPITLDGTLFLTNKKLYYLSSSGLIFKKRELVLDIDYKDIVTVLTQGVLIKNLVIGTEKDGKVINHTFTGLPATDAQNKIKQIKAIKAEDTKPEKEQTPLLSDIKKDTVKKQPVLEEKKEKVNETEKIKYCDNCGYKIMQIDNFCAGCRKPQKQNFTSPFIAKVSKAIKKEINEIEQSNPKIKKIEEALKKESSYCKNCGKITKDKEKFCVSCGQEKTKIKKQNFCEKCGTPYQKEDKFCRGCGVKI